MSSPCKMRWCERFVQLDGEPIRFAGRPYLPTIYSCEHGNLVLRCARQTEKSTLLCNTIVWQLCTNRHTGILFVTPREEQGRTFVRTRLLPVIERSPLIRRHLLGRKGRRPQITNMEFVNGSRFYMRAAYHSADSARGLSAEVLMVDEFQDVAAGALPVLQETLSHAACPRTLLTGTPKSIDNQLEAFFRRSTANEWLVPCPACGQETAMDERCLGAEGIVCAECHRPIDPAKGRWVARNPGADWGEGYCIAHPMVPWVDHHDLLEKQRSYDPVGFKNEVLGLPSSLGDHVITRAEIEACCGRDSMARRRQDIPAQFRTHLVAGIDWGGGSASRTVLTVGYLDADNVLQVCYLERFEAREDPNHIVDEIARRCRGLGVDWIGADGGGNGHVYNRLLFDKLGTGRYQLFALLYSAADQSPTRDGALWRWTVNRSAAIGAVFSRIKKELLAFPRADQVGGFLDDFTAEVAEYDEHQRTVRFTHPDTQPDDALHATVYMMHVALRRRDAARPWAG